MQVPFALRALSSPVICAVLMAAFHPVPCKADALDNWNSLQVVTNPVGYAGFNFGGIAYGNGRYVAVGAYVGDDNGMVQTSDDGLNWTVRSGYYTVLDLFDVAFGNGTFVAVGWEGFGGNNIYNSVDGVQWTSHLSSVANVFRVIYGGGLFVAVGDASLPVRSGGTTNRNIFTSPDGVTWTARNSGSPTSDPQMIYDIAWGAGHFVAVDFAHHFYTSTTGSTWQRTTNSVAGGRISYCNGLFIVPAGSGGNLLSTDGTNWTLVTNNTGAVFLRVIYGSGCFVALAGASLFTSADGTNWQSRPIQLPSHGSLSAATYAHEQFMAVGGTYGAPVSVPLAYVSDPVVGVKINQGFPPALAISGLLGRTYRIDYTDALQFSGWNAGGTLTLTNSPQTWADPQPNLGSRCYRAVLLP